jgi:hypothetical protein
MKWELAGETEVLGGSLPQSHFVHPKCLITWHGIEPGPPRWEGATNHLSYGTASGLTWHAVGSHPDYLDQGITHGA